MVNLLQPGLHFLLLTMMPHSRFGADARPDLDALRRCASRFHRAQAVVGGADVGHPNIVSLMGNGSGR